jgi:hypothetical protein
MLKVAYKYVNKLYLQVLQNTMKSACVWIQQAFYIWVVSCYFLMLSNYVKTSFHDIQAPFCYSNDDFH